MIIKRSREHPGIYACAPCIVHTPAVRACGACGVVCMPWRDVAWRYSSQRAPRACVRSARARGACVRCVHVLCSCTACVHHVSALHACAAMCTLHLCAVCMHYGVCTGLRWRALGWCALGWCALRCAGVCSCVLRCAAVARGVRARECVACVRGVAWRWYCAGAGAGKARRGLHVHKRAYACIRPACRGDKACPHSFAQFEKFRGQSSREQRRYLDWCPVLAAHLCGQYPVLGWRPAGLKLGTCYVAGALGSSTEVSSVGGPAPDKEQLAWYMGWCSRHSTQEKVWGPLELAPPGTSRGTPRTAVLVDRQCQW